MANFPFIFGAALVLCVGMTFRSSDLYKAKMGNKAGSPGPDGEISEEHKRIHTNLLKKYLLVYLLATLSDWLQGPYVYALYMEYGFEQHEIAQLFVAGFGSSMIFGSFVGGMADWGGRRTFVILFAIVYAASCLTKHFKHYGILMLGRLLGGVATSLLFSVFDAWLIRSHDDANLPKSMLSKSFSWAAFGNSVVAISAGLVANKIAHLYPMEKLSSSEDLIFYGGFLNPFDLALLALIMCGTAALMLWEENYGESKASEDDNSDDGRQRTKWYAGLQSAFTTTMRNREIMLCGIISSLFEGSMYIFVFMWTPLLRALSKDPSVDLPFGVIFSTFMVCCMTGSSLFSIVVEHYPVEKLAICIFAVGSVAMAMVAIDLSDTFSFLGMNIFEICVGMYFPIMGTMKGGIVPEDKRAAIYNLYRVPLNFIVLFSLLTDLTPVLSFWLNAAMLGLATFLQMILTKRRLDSKGINDSMISKVIETEPLIENSDNKPSNEEPV